MKIIQNLWFEKDMEAALRLYTSLVAGSSLDWMMPIPSDTPSGPAGSVTMAGFTLAGQNYMAIEAGPLDSFNHASSIMVECDSQQEIDHLWDRLGDGGVEEQCGWLRDRWGLCWQIVPRRLGELLSDPDKDKAKRVTEAMLGMVKLDIDALEAAAAQS